VRRARLLLVACTAAACSSASPAAPKPVEEGCPTSSATWSKTGDLLSCPQTFAAFCAQATSCPSGGFDQLLTEQNATGFPPNLFACSPYDYADEGWSCGDGVNEVLFAYDKTTGKAIAAIEVKVDEMQQTCLGGPATIAGLDHCTQYFSCLPTDAGYDASHCPGDASLASLNAADGGD
jgi:hypothetical protein